MSDSLRTKQILLAGGTGGLGSACARLLAAEGARLTLSYLSNRARAETLAGLGSVVQAGLQSREDRQRLLDGIDDLYGVAVFAGNPARAATFEQAMRLSIDTNFLGPIELAREAAERMRHNGTPGAIVLVSTMQAVALFPGSTAYGAPKAALLHAARILAKECRGKTNIRVNVVCPGVHRTGMAEASITSGKYDGYIANDVIHRFGAPEDTARAVRFFLEPDNYVTGQVVTVDGGLTL